VAREFAGRDGAAFRSIKRLLRNGIAEKIALEEDASIREFINIWYSEETWAKLQEIKITA
jgi:hypothetical protein